MTLNLAPVERAKTYELVVHRIKEEIFAGRLRPGDRLPGERQLSEQLKVSRPSVREAIRVLESMEIVRTSPGAGPSSGLVISTQPSRALTDLLGLHVALSSYSVAEVMNVRTALEVRAVRTLANRAERDLSGIEDTLAKMSEPGIPRQRFHDLDTDFHVEMARATGEALLADLMMALREAVRRPMDAVFSDESCWPELRDVLVREHVEIFEAVRDRHVERSAELMKKHIEGVYEHLEQGATASAEAN